MSIYDSTLEIPQDVQKAAMKVSEWFETQGHAHWELLGTASRKLLEALRSENAELSRHIRNLEDFCDEYALRKATKRTAEQKDL